MLSIGKFTLMATRDNIMFGYVNKSLKTGMSMKQSIDEYIDEFEDERDYYALKMQYYRMLEKARV